MSLRFSSASVHRGWVFGIRPLRTYLKYGACLTRTLYISGITIDVVLNNRLVLNYLLAKQRGVCSVMNKTCCRYVSNSGQIEVNIKQICEPAQRLQKYNTQGPDPNSFWNMVRQNLSGLTYYLPFLSPLDAIVLLLILGPCLLNCLVNFVSKMTEAKLHRF